MSSLSIGDFAKWKSHSEVDYVIILNIQSKGHYGVRVSLTSPPEIRGKRFKVSHSNLEKIKDQEYED